MPSSPGVAMVPVAVPADSDRATLRQLAGAMLALTKPRLGFFSVLTAMGAYAASAHPAGYLHAGLALTGITCAAGGALSLNQWWERDLDTRMRRTRNRPLPRRQLPPRVALAWSLSLAVVGVGILAAWVHVYAAALALATIVAYGIIYTPLKRRTRWATEIGAISGALPPWLGAAAAGDAMSAPGGILAVVLFLWQMPHFFAIGWMYRDDYRAAGFPLLPAIDATGGRRTAAWSFGYTLALVPVALVPWAVGVAGAIYGGATLVGGGWMLGRAWQFVTRAGDRDRAARRLFVATIACLPLILGGLLLDRLI